MFLFSHCLLCAREPSPKVGRPASYIDHFPSRFRTVAFLVQQSFCPHFTSRPLTITSPPSQQTIPIAEANLLQPLPVSWQYGHAHPSGEAVEVKAGEVTVTSARGNDITKTGTEADPAVHISRPGGNDVVQRASKLTIDEEGPNHHHGDAGEGASAQAAGEEDEDEGDGKGVAAAPAPKKGGRGRPKKAAGAAAGAAEKKKKAPAAKKTKVVKAKAPASGAANADKESAGTGNANGEKKKGRPKSMASKDDAKPKKRAATDDGELSRSKMNKT